MRKVLFDNPIPIQSDIACAKAIQIRPRSGLHGQAFQLNGFSVATPIGAKSATLRVTTVRPRTSAVAAMQP